jgi:hypothetical protein
MYGKKMVWLGGEDYRRWGSAQVNKVTNSGAFPLIVKDRKLTFCPLSLGLLLFSMIGVVFLLLLLRTGYKFFASLGGTISCFKAEAI